MATGRFWGSRQRLWGGDTDVRRWNVATEQFIVDNAICHFALTATFSDGHSFSVWTAGEDASIGGVRYTAVGPNFVSIDSIQSSLTGGQGNLRVTLNDVGTEYRARFRQDPGRVLVTVRLVYSLDGGVNWRVFPRSVVGELSRPQLSGGTYSIEIASYKDSLDRGFQQVWSHERQIQDYPGDIGFEHLRGLSDGSFGQIRWP